MLPLAYVTQVRIMKWLKTTEATIHWYIGMHVIQRIRLCMYVIYRIQLHHTRSLYYVCAITAHRACSAHPMRAGVYAVNELNHAMWKVHTKFNKVGTCVHAYVPFWWWCQCSQQWAEKWFLPRLSARSSTTLSSHQSREWSCSVKQPSGGL